jgi:hypothetical protein
LLLKRPDALFNLSALRTLGCFDQVVLVEVDGSLRVTLAPTGLRHVEKESGIAADGVGLLEFIGRFIPATHVEELLSLAKMRARLFRRSILPTRDPCVQR